MRFTALIAAMAVAIAVSATAAAGVTASVSATTVEVGVPFDLTLNIEGKDIGDPELPQTDDFTIDGPFGRSTGTQISIVNGKTSMVRSARLTYRVTALKTGRRTIPAISVKVGDDTAWSEPILVDVVGQSRQTVGFTGQNGPPSGTQPARPDDPPSPTGRQPLTWDIAAFAEAEASAAEVYQGQQIQLVLRLWMVDDANVGVDMDTVDTQGFYAVPETPTRIRVEPKSRYGWNYEVSTYLQLLYPATTGELTIGSWRGTAGRKAFFGGIDPQTRLTTDPITITVKPLPPAPPGFSGAVGTFELAATLSEKEVVQGMPVEVRLRVFGSGNPDAIAAPSLDSIEGAYVTSPEASVEQNVEREAYLKTFVYTVTPLEAGDLTIPPLEFLYFDPDDGQYKTVATDPFAVHVLASPESDSRLYTADEGRPAAAGNGVQVLGEDILPAIRAPRSLSPRDGHPAGTGVAVVAPPFAFVAYALYLRRRNRFDTDIAFARSHRARTAFRKRIEAAQLDEEPWDGLYRALVGYIADKLNIPEAGLTSADVVERLKDRGIDDALAADVAKILRACERARYASAGLTGDEVRALTEAAVQRVDELDGSFRKERRS